ncbi:MAG TPA: DNA-directed RNA polymerase subunit F [Euryarchaeota archaeon]|nr:DNA-directed RNA polymerase subunit F [Euryarchaeota archaeon]HIQ10010.1 DNA-directed RNA polymerase subunit F [Euryarchaeota archaeon]
MIGKEIISSRPVTVPEAGEIVRSLEGEQTYEQKATLEYVKRVARVDAPTAREAVQKLVELGLSEELAVKIVNVWPEDMIDLYTVLAKEEGVTEDLYEKILEALRE